MRIITRAPVDRGRGARGTVPSARTRDYPDPYYTLVCGHLTSRETQVAYSAWKPRENKNFCEACGKWQEEKPKPKREPLPQEPMF